jgi:phenylacetate-CoA ligase
MVEMLTWDRARLAAAREAGLRRLLDHAVAHSPWHRDHLCSLSVEALREADLPSLPTMSKTDLNESFDEIVTDRRLTRRVVEDHLATLDDGDAYLFDEYHVIATGGSSGRRTLVVGDWDGWTDLFANSRWRRLTAGCASGRKSVASGSEAASTPRRAS